MTKLATLMACVIAGSASACQREGQTEWGIPSTETFLIHSSTARRDYQIGVALPTGYAQSQMKYPVLYVLDANGTFSIAVDTERLLAVSGEVKHEPIIVGIGYRLGPFANTLSTRVTDLTPTADPADDREYAKELQQQPPPVSGGGPAFLQFLRDELFPTIEGRYRIDPAQRALHGHSLGGLFALDVFFRQPDLFRAFLISSPALWWDHEAIWKVEQEFGRNHQRLTARVFLTSGLLEEPEGDQAKAAFRLVSNVRKLDDLFRTRAYVGLTWSTQIFEGETHNSMIPVGLARGLRWLYGEAAVK